MKLSEVTLLEVISQFPEVAQLNINVFTSKHQYFDFFLSALGFEERTLGLPKLFSTSGNIKFDEMIYFQYETSTIENAYNEPKLIEYFKAIGNKSHKLFCDEPGFINQLKSAITKKVQEKNDTPVKVMLDISVCSSKLILSLVKALLELKIELLIVYTEAKVYFPKYSDYVSDKDALKEKSIVADEKVVLSSEFSGGNKTNADLIISFPNFKAQRVKNIISEIDETVLLKPDDRLIWIVGEPHTDNNTDAENRKEMMLFLNDIQVDSKIYEVSTLEYKKTIEQLEHIYQKNNLDYHINIADLGSKMQTLGIAIFCLIRSEISVYHTVPKTYGPSKYSEGIKEFWMIEFGKANEIIDKINTIDTLTLY